MPEPRSISSVIEFVCTECGQLIGAFGHVNEFKLCATCLFMPGWHEDPRLRSLLGPGMPPLAKDGAS